ncbi:MAG: LytTR family DNA-binding domain-containing protein [Bacteroidota bacterium]
MKFSNIQFKSANQYLPWVLAVGAALGVASFSLGLWATLGQALVQQLLISLVIGYGIFVVNFNVSKDLPTKKQYLILGLLFVALGILGTEIEQLTKVFLFQQGAYHFPNASGYVFNCILSMVLGAGCYNFINRTSESENTTVEEILTPIEVAPKSIPIHQGESVQLYELDHVIYFEAYDNYSFLYDLKGNKHLCNYSLRYLEDTLGADFIRVYRKYLINKTQIHSITPHFKGRFVIEFKDKARSSITSSSSHTDLIKGLMKI